MATDADPVDGGPPPLTTEQAVQLITLRAESAAAERAAKWENMMTDPAGAMLMTGSYGWDHQDDGGVTMSNGKVIVTFGKPEVTWKAGQPPPRPPGPSELAPDKQRTLLALEQHYHALLVRGDN